MRLVFVPSALAMAVAIVGYNGWLAFRGVDVKITRSPSSVPSAVTSGLTSAIALAKVAAVAIGLVAAVRILPHRTEPPGSVAQPLGPAAGQRPQPQDLFGGIERAIVITSWMLLAVFACQLLHAPATLVDGLLRTVRAYVVDCGRPSARSLVGGNRRYLRRAQLTDIRMIVAGCSYYEHLRPLVPTFRASLDTRYGSPSRRWRFCSSEPARGGMGTEPDPGHRHFLSQQRRHRAWTTRNRPSTAPRPDSMK